MRGWSMQAFQRADSQCRTGYNRISGISARNVRHTYVLPSEDKKTWRVQQVLVDPEEHNDWMAEFEVDLAASRAAAEPVLRLRRIASIG